MTHDPSPSARQAKTLPARPSLEHLKNEAKRRLKGAAQPRPASQARFSPSSRLRASTASQAGRQLKAHVDKISPAQLDREKVFDAGESGRCRGRPPCPRSRLRSRLDR